MDVRIRPESPVDYDDVRAVVAAAFVDRPAVADLVDFIRTSPEYEPDFALVARDSDTDDVVGFVMISHAELDDSGRLHDVLTLSPLAVAPDHQRHGIGGALVRAVLAAAEGDPRRFGLVTLEGSPRYYGRLGFEYAPDFGVTIDLPDWAPKEAAQVFRLTGYDPAVRGRVVYPPAFSSVT